MVQRVLALVSQPILCATICRSYRIIRYRLKGKSGGDDQPILKPYYEGFKGNIESWRKRISITGVYEKIGVDKIKLPNYLSVFGPRLQTIFGDSYG